MIRSVILAGAFALSACATGATEQDTAERDCFFSSSVRGYSVIDDRHVGITVGANRQYVLTTSWNTYDLDWSHAIALRSSTGSICTGNGLGVEIIGGRPQRTYLVTAIERAPEPAPAEQQQ